MPFFRFSATSTAPHDGYNVLEPYVGTGRWLLLRHDASVPTIAELAAIPTTQRSDGMALYVNGENAWYEYDTAAPSIGDITPTQGTGRWVKVTTPDQVIAPFQKTYNHIDAIGVADSFTVNYPTQTDYPYKDAIAAADRITYSIVPPAPHKDAIALADRITYTVIPPANHQDAIAIADRITYSVIGLAIYPHKDAISIADKITYFAITPINYKDAISIADRHQLEDTAIDFNTIVVDNAGNVVTSNGFVVSTDGNPSFDTIVVDNAGNVVTSNGFVVSTDGNPAFDAIVVDASGNVVTSGGFVVTSS